MLPACILCLARRKRTKFICSTNSQPIAVQSQLQMNFQKEIQRFSIVASKTKLEANESRLIFRIPAQLLAAHE